MFLRCFRCYVFTLFYFRAFPNCPFGTKCHFIHPSCRFDSHCTRFDCPFTHLTKRAATSTAGVVLSAPTTPISQPVVFIPHSAPVLKTSVMNKPSLIRARKSLYKLNKAANGNSKYMINHRAVGVVEPMKNEIVSCGFGLCKFFMASFFVVFLGM
jgi:hypothetical protein